jgi:hypothetical protein
MKAERPKLVPAKDILLELFNDSETELASFLLRHTYFISPQRIRQCYEQKGSFAWFPACVRGSHEHHKGKQRKDLSVWESRPVQVCDNTKG